MTKKTLFIAALGAIALVVLIGCPWFEPGVEPEDATGTGTLRLNFAPEAQARTIDPPLVMTINDYVITVSGPADTQTQTLDGTATTTTFTGLVVGAWTVTVNARNNDATPVIIATATASATGTIVADETTTLNLTVTPVSGQGTLQLAVSWPDTLLADPGITATLTPQSGTAQSITAGFTVDPPEAPNTASYLASWGAGYYTLTLDLTDGGTAVWQEVVAVRIIEGETSVGSYTLSASDINVVAETGALKVNIGADLQNPYTIAFTGQQSQITTEESMTVTATLDPVGTPDSYEWYLNGALQSGVTGNAITVGPSGIAVTEGTAYRLSLLVTDGVTISSEATSFEVVAP